VPVIPIFIQISSDPGLSGTDLPDSTTATVPKPKAANALFNEEALSPPLTLLATRTARGVLASKQLFEKEPGLESSSFHFRICRDKKRNPALGWVLSRSAEENIRKGLHGDHCDNETKFKKLTSFLADYQTAPRNDLH